MALKCIITNVENENKDILRFSINHQNDIEEVLDGDAKTFCSYLPYMFAN